MTIRKNRQSRKQERREVALLNLRKNIGQKPKLEGYKDKVLERITCLETVVGNSSNRIVRTKKKREGKRNG